MTDIPNEKKGTSEKDDPGELPELDDNHEERSYYYDDAHGYRNYDPASDDDDFDD